MKEKEIKKSETGKIERSPKERKAPEISPEAREERQLLTAFLLEKTKELIDERNKRKKRIEEEEIELRSGKTISRIGIIKFVSALRQIIYCARFPNDNPFFEHMFRLHPKLYGLDYKKYRKPALAGKLLKQLIYDRFRTEFSVEVLPALVVLAMPGGVRLFKFHEFLTVEGIKQLIRFRNEANEMMKKYDDLKWYEFKKEFSTKYKQVFQPTLL